MSTHDLKSFSDTELLDELSERGVLTEEWKRSACGAPCPDATRFSKEPCLHPCNLARGHDDGHEHDVWGENYRRHVWGRKAEDGAYPASYRHVTAWSEDDNVAERNRAVFTIATLRSTDERV